MEEFLENWDIKIKQLFTEWGMLPFKSFLVLIEFYRSNYNIVISLSDSTYHAVC